jgi:ribosome-associated protein
VSGPVRVRGSVVIPERELRWRFARAAGPGGQHVNTSATAVELSYDVARSEALPPVYRERALTRLAHRLVDGVLTVRASERRSQLRNREMAKARLAALLGEATAPPPPARRPTRPSRGMHERRLENKRRRSAVKRSRAQSRHRPGRRFPGED